MVHIGREGLMEKLKELNIETLTVEHPEVYERFMNYCIQLTLICRFL